MYLVFKSSSYRTQKNICRSISEKKESMDLRNQKEVKEIYKIRNTSKEEILCVLQTRCHFLQPSVLCAICKSKDCVKRKVFSESNVPSVLNEKHNQCSEQQSQRWLTRMFFWCKCCSDYYSVKILCLR